ncbi:MAG TPA: sulfite exporter TauE/SafE family protein [Kofleriaceae bacterium]|jgi:sulfite exporter TauE/SafE|nr:sulfite exporter TauE/SafE family protein [Kofleriaceae bacterium]
MIALLVATLLASLAGSVHCAAMCGPFAALAGSGGGPGAPVAWSLGRLAVYAALGALAGALGATIDLAGGLIHVQRGATVLAGLLVLAMGLLQLAAALGVRLPAPGSGRLVRRALVPLQRRRPATRAALLGLLTAALPCGWLYAFVVAAAGTGGPARGALLMTAFWLGTVPMLFGIGVLVRPLAERLGRRRPLITAGALVALGLAAIAVRTPALAAPPPPPPAAAAAAIPAMPPEGPLCHGGH